MTGAIRTHEQRRNRSPAKHRGLQRTITQRELIGPEPGNDSWEVVPVRWLVKATQRSKVSNSGALESLYHVTVGLRFP